MLLWQLFYLFSANFWNLSLMKRKYFNLLLIIMFAGCYEKDKISSLNLGSELYVSNNCNMCHSLDGSSKIGPTFKGLFGKTVKLNNGKFRIVDEQYLYESIVYPLKEIVDGYDAKMDAVYQGLSKDEINALIQFIKNVKN